MIVLLSEISESIQFICSGISHRYELILEAVVYHPLNQLTERETNIKIKGKKVQIIRYRSTETIMFHSPVTQLIFFYFEKNEALFKFSNV